jgi:hypothetical protein
MIFKVVASENITFQKENELHKLITMKRDKREKKKYLENTLKF